MISDWNCPSSGAQSHRIQRFAGQLPPISWKECAAAASFLATLRIQCKKRMAKVKISLSSTEVSEVASAVHVFRDIRKQPQPIATAVLPAGSIRQ